jgi:AcrR family transcriptional regulator
VSVTRGRRPGGPDTRAQVVAAARELFAARGFAGTSVRAVAGRAGVDPALVHHYFGSKDDLMLASLELPVDPRALLAGVVGEGVADAGAGIVRTLVTIWDDPGAQPALLGAARRMLEPGGEGMFRDVFVPTVLLPVGEGLGLDHAERRMAFVASQLLGLVLVRYLIRLDPVASMPVDEVVATYGPTLQRYLTGELPLT